VTTRRHPLRRAALLFATLLVVAPLQDLDAQARSTRKSTASRRTTPKKPAVRRTSAPVGPKLSFTAPVGEAALASDLANLIGAKTRNGTWGAMVISLTRGDTLFAHNPGQAIVPASTMKLFTSALALETLGPTHQFMTQVLRDGDLSRDGTLRGDLILRGGGDPSLSTRLRTADTQPMQLLARQVAATGIRRVEGDLVADASAFEAKKIPDGWLPRYLESSYAARVSPLSLNENVATVVVSPGGGGLASIVLDPPSTTIPIANSVRVRAGSRGAQVSVRRTSSGALEARGWIGSRSDSRYYGVVVDEPALWTAGALRAALAAQGITITGRVRLAEAGAEAVLVTGLPSPPLGRLAAVMNRESNNHYAELLFRNVAHLAAPDRLGSAEQANAMLRKFLADKVGVNPGDVHAADGSGLSTLDRVTPRSLVQLLSFGHRASWAADYHASLPVAGESETLRYRMRQTPAQGNLHAKTGTTNEVVALSGYVTARSGELLAFAMVYNGVDRWNAREVIDLAGATMAGFAR
jgi:D-alanyl-D-alanine carboxypeptidase/D-alanyl-D-alanine-endopeptidase (penicillin-binding protein 4)